MIGRLTLQGGVRYDRPRIRFLEQTAGLHAVRPQRVHHSGDGRARGINDITPRMAAAYDLNGDGKTALKMTLGKYMGARDWRHPGRER